MQKKKNLRPKSIKEWSRPLIVGAVVGLLCASAFLFGVFDTWSKRISDRLYLPYEADKKIVIVAIDDQSMARFGRWPWDRHVHADLIEHIAQSGAAAIGYDVNFPEAQDKENDTRLAEAIKGAGNVVLPVELEMVFKGGQVGYTANRMLPPISQIAAAASAVGHTNTPQDADGVVRRVPIRVYFEDGGSVLAFAYKILEVAGIRKDFSKGTDEAGRMIVHYPDQPGKGFTTISAADALDNNSRNFFKDKIVLIGATAADLHDNQRVPTSINQPMDGVEIHASLLNTILQENYLFELPAWLMALWIIVIGVLIGAIIPFFRARFSVPLAIILWIGSIIAGFILFDGGWIVDILWLTVVIILSFAAVILERRVESERQKREIKQAFSYYVSSSVVDSILEDPSQLQLGGVRKDMTVLFSDVRGFTTISEGLRPEDLVKLMNTYLTKMTDIVFKNEGVLDKYIGDAVMAFWNAPLTQEDHARRAVDTALLMLAKLKEMNEEKAFGGLELKIGVGINSGEMVVGNMGSKERFDYTVIGDNVNLGSRMEGLTKQYGISLLISESTKNELPVEGYLIRPIDLVAVKGKNKPIKMYEVLMESARATERDKRLAEEYTKALEAYFNKDFTLSVQITDKLKLDYPDDGPSRTLNERAKIFLQDPPPDDWDGAWIMKTK